MSERLKKVNQLIKKELGQILKESISIEKGLITISRVKTSSDLREAKVLISIFPLSKKDEILAEIEKKSSKIQNILGQRVVLKYTPKIRIVFDDSYQYESDMESLFNKIRNDKMNC